ncbi:MAG: hypothetical protein MK209_03200 [Planctomycetes bacterium]|nr:hypothetical protein [Planctomycetota bacterium]
MSLLIPAEAAQILNALAPKEASWPAHCRQVARVARTLADALIDTGADLDEVLDPWWGNESAPAVESQPAHKSLTPEDLETWALVHDIGRAIDHGPLHGWIGYRILADRGHASSARGCLTHWLKGRSSDELRAAGIGEDLIVQVAAALHPLHWRLADSVLSFADSSVAGHAIVPIALRHTDLRDRYGDSAWMDQHEELGNRAAVHISKALGQHIDSWMSPLYDSEPNHV